MPKQEFEYRLFYENNERAGKLSQEDYYTYLEMVDYMRDQGDSVIAIDIYMAAALNDFEAAAAKGKKAKNVVGKDIGAYITTLKQQVDYTGQLNLRKMKESEGFMFSGVFMYLCAAIVCYFIREILKDTYLLGFYGDLAIAVIAVFFIAVGLYQRKKIIRRWNFSTNAFVVDFFVLVISVLFVYTLRKQPFDYSAVLLLGGFILSSIFIKKEFKQVTYHQDVSTSFFHVKSCNNEFFIYFINAYELCSNKCTLGFVLYGFMINRHFFNFCLKKYTFIDILFDVE